MRNTVSYEWDYETKDGEDIIDHHHADKLADFSPEDVTDSLVLVRDSGNESKGLETREWAYVVNGTLPEYFQDAAGNATTRIPVRYHNELAKYLNQ